MSGNHETSQGKNMNRDQMKGQWKQLKGRVRERWGKLTDDDVDQIQGRRQELVGRIQERYGRNREAAENEVDGWLDELEEPRSTTKESRRSTRKESQHDVR
jgi:uncharacterized protein YjbJ (UPF0337 family)